MNLREYNHWTVDLPCFKFVFFLEEKLNRDFFSFRIVGFSDNGFGFIKSALPFPQAIQSVCQGTGAAPCLTDIQGCPGGCPYREVLVEKSGDGGDISKTI